MFAIGQILESEIVECKPSDPPEFARVQCQTVLPASGHVWGVRGPGRGSHALRGRLLLLLQGQY